MKKINTILLAAIMLVISMVLVFSGCDSSSNPTPVIKGKFVIEGDNTYYELNDGTRLRSEYVRDGDDIWFFCNDTRGIPVYYYYLADNLIQVFDYGYDSCFLLIGENEALWVDSMFGFGNLAKLTKMFTNKPIKGVALTHKDIDHVGGSFHFDNVYLNQLGWPTNGGMGFATQQARYDDNMTTIRFHNDFGFSINDYAENSEVNLIDFPDGTVIDVGGASIEAIHTPGHGADMTMILFREHRILLTGDGCNHNTLIGSTYVDAYRNVIQGLIDRKVAKNEWDKLYISHGEHDHGTLAPDNMFEEMVQICDGIMDGSIPGGRWFGRWRAYEVFPNQMRVDGGFTNLVYNPANIHTP